MTSTGAGATVGAAVASAGAAVGAAVGTAVAEAPQATSTNISAIMKNANIPLGRKIVRLSMIILNATSLFFGTFTLADQALRQGYCGSPASG